MIKQYEIYLKIYEMAVREIRYVTNHTFFFILITFIFLAAINNRVVTELINVTEWEGRDASLQTHT